MQSVLKWHGGKRYLAKKIVAMMPPHLHYVEPYAGSLAVLFEHEPNGTSEVVNDQHDGLMNFWRVIRDPERFDEFERHIIATPFSETEFEMARYIGRSDGDVCAAVAFFIACRQSRSGCFKDFAPLTRRRLRAGMNEQAAAWLSAIDRLPEVHARLKRVVILNRDALAVIRGQDGPQTLFYLDPPYLHETRATTGQYAHEMTTDDHAALLATLAKIKGKFLLSGYLSALYQGQADAHGWQRVDIKIPNHAAGGKTKRIQTECVWRNF